MLGYLYEGQICSAARTLEVTGERWTLLIIRDAMFGGMTRFSDFRNSLGIAPNILAKRLAHLVDAGILDKRGDDTSGHAEYVLTARGYDLQPVIIALTEWGDKWAAPDEGRPLAYEHDGCGGRIALQVTCKRCGDVPRSTAVRVRLARWFRDIRYSKNQRPSSADG
jgi:DNA-binding HxlR family transcriptional regulator